MKKCAFVSPLAILSVVAWHRQHFIAPANASAVYLFPHVPQHRLTAGAPAPPSSAQPINSGAVGHVRPSRVQG